MFRILKFVLAVLVFGFWLAACEKEQSTENGGLTGTGGSSSGTAIYTLDGAPGACVTPVVNGDYIVDSALDITNSVIISVNVTTVGTYTISTGLLNGIRFTASGAFSTTGAQAITLLGSGTPNNPTTNTFVPGTNGCSFTITATDASTAPECKACSYYPFCDGSTYTYIDSSGTTGTASTSTLSIISDTTVDGKIFNKANTGAGTPVSYHNCTSGVTTLFGFNMGDRITTTVLKANEGVGATWEDVEPPVSGSVSTYSWEIIEKGISRIILGTTYPDVIHVHLTGMATITGVPPIQFADADYYYAKGVGLIDNIQRSGGAVVARRVLQSYFIP